MVEVATPESDAADRDDHGPPPNSEAFREPPRLNGGVRGLDAVTHRNDFIRAAKFAERQRSTYLAVALAVVIAAYPITIILTRGNDQVLGLTCDGRLVQLAPLDQPHRAEQEVVAWAVNAVEQTMTMGHHDYKGALERNRQWFTPEGYVQFYSAISKRNGFLTSMEEFRQIYTAYRNGPATIPRMFRDRGVYHWEVHVPVSITVESGGKQQARNTVIKLLIARDQRLERGHGMGIVQWVE